jgi:hypothetical protein
MTGDGERAGGRPGLSRRDWLAVLAGVGLLFVVRDLMRERVPEAPDPERTREALLERLDGRRAEAGGPRWEPSEAERAERIGLLRDGLAAFGDAPPEERARSVAVAYPLAVATLIELGALHGELLDQPPAPSGSASGGFARQRHAFEVDGRWYRFEALDVPEYGAWARRLAVEDAAPAPGAGTGPAADADEELRETTARAVEARLREALARLERG